MVKKGAPDDGNGNYGRDPGSSTRTRDWQSEKRQKTAGTKTPPLLSASDDGDDHVRLPLITHAAGEDSEAALSAVGRDAARRPAKRGGCLRVLPRSATSWFLQRTPRTQTLRGLRAVRGRKVDCQIDEESTGFCPTKAARVGIHPR